MAPVEALKAFAHEFIRTLSALNLDEMLALRESECTHQVLPKSMGYPPIDNATYRERYASRLPYFQGFTCSIYGDIICDTLANKVVIHASSSATKTPAGPYGNEYMFILHLNEDATKLKHIEEYVDSAASKEQNAKLAEAIKKLGEEDIWNGVKAEKAEK